MLRPILLFALSCSLVALSSTTEVAAVNEAVSGVTEQSLAYISGVLTIPDCSSCPCSGCSCSHCSSAISIGAPAPSQFKAVEKTVESAASRLRSAVRKLKRLTKDNAAMRAKESKDMAEEKRLVEIAKKLDKKFPNIVEVTGPRGPRGARGPRGRDGRRGSKGPHGVGVLGAPGAPGLPGPQGAPGVRGTRSGPRGPKGPPGPPGRPGPQGNRGNKGAQGDKGAPGLLGPRGVQGAPGAAGATGARGPTGPTGLIGNRGPPGVRGKGRRGPPGPRGPAGPQGLPGPAGKTGIIKKAPRKFFPEPFRTKFLSSTMGLSWLDAQQQCRANGFRGLCSKPNLCPNKHYKASKVLAHGDTYVPYAGAGVNAWLSVGDNRRFCQSHQRLFGSRPSWGNAPNNGPFHGPLYCCGGAPKPAKYRTIVGYSYGMNWNDAKNVCKANKLKLCNYVSVCPNGKGKPPVEGKQDHDAWSPVDGSPNSWVQVGTGWTQCAFHFEIASHMPPGWGEDRNRGTFHGPIYCCGNKKPRVEKPVQMSQGSSGFMWKDVKQLCIDYKMHLCSISDLCPNGWGNDAAVSKRTHDDWIAISDGRPDSWIQIGNGWPVCHRHSEVGNPPGQYGRPGWGNQRVAAPYKGEVFCCGKKPLPRKPISVSTGKGKNWDDAVAICDAQKMSLCRYWDICPNGPGKPPVIGQQNHDSWTPILDGVPNNFVQVGNGWPVCNRHSEINNGAYGPPGWGSQRGSEDYRADIYCCKGE